MRPANSTNNNECFNLTPMAGKPNIREIKDLILASLVKFDFQVKRAVDEHNKESLHSISRVSVYDWLKNDKQFKAEFDLLKEELLDEAEHSHRLLRKGISITDETTGELIAWQEKPDRAAIEFFLKSKGKGRGYEDIQKYDHTTNGDSLNAVQLTPERIKQISDELENDV